MNRFYLLNPARTLSCHHYEEDYSKLRSASADSPAGADEGRRSST